MDGGVGWEQERVVRAVTELMAEDEDAPHVIVVVDEVLGLGAAAGPFYGAVQALGAAERLEAALNAGAVDPPVRTRVLRLFSPASG
jgi:hypothetical protein